MVNVYKHPTTGQLVGGPIATGNASWPYGLQREGGVWHKVFRSRDAAMSWLDRYGYRVVEL